MWTASPLRSRRRRPPDGRPLPRARRAPARPTPRHGRRERRRGCGGGHRTPVRRRAAAGPASERGGRRPGGMVADAVGAPAPPRRHHAGRSSGRGLRRSASAAAAPPVQRTAVRPRRQGPAVFGGRGRAVRHHRQTPESARRYGDPPRPVAGAPRRQRAAAGTRRRTPRRRVMRAAAPPPRPSSSGIDRAASPSFAGPLCSPRRTAAFLRCRRSAVAPASTVEATRVCSTDPGTVVRTPAIPAGSGLRRTPEPNPAACHQSGGSPSFPPNHTSPSRSTPTTFTHPLVQPHVQVHVAQALATPPQGGPMPPCVLLSHADRATPSLNGVAA